MTLMNSAPALISSRAALRQASTPSTSRPSMPSLRSKKLVSRVSKRPRKSEWPLVCDRALQQMTRRGAAISP
jgi:hypothetical protein